MVWTRNLAHLTAKRFCARIHLSFVQQWLKSLTQQVDTHSHFASDKMLGILSVMNSLPNISLMTR
jgi:hypothetical protein